MTPDSQAPAIRHETPVPSPASDRVYGSDAIAATLRALDISYIALNPAQATAGCTTAW